jgi:hypothetical protein
VRDRPARAARAEAQTRLQIQPVDLVDDAIDVIGQIGARKPDLVVVVDQRLDAFEPPCQRVDRKAPALANTSIMPCWVSAGISDISPQA